MALIPGEITEFYTSKQTNGAYFSVEKLAKNERAANKRIAKVFADKGHLVELFDQNSLDAMVDGRWNEFKSPAATKNAIDLVARKANSQFKKRDLLGDLTLELPKNFESKTVRTALRTRFNRKDYDVRIENIHFVSNGKYLGKAGINQVINGDLPL